jgi:hypothetical protein
MDEDFFSLDITKEQNETLKRVKKKESEPLKDQPRIDQVFKKLK